jgi:glycosyltransferase involved in cell wall biosynthesis
LHPKKGLKLLIETFLTLSNRREFQDWRLLLAGNGSPAYVQELRRLVQDKGGDEHVIFTGWLDGREKIAAFRDSALFALPSYQENFGLALLEAMSFGVPVLVSRNIDLATEIEHARAGWVTSLEGDAFAAVLADALLDHQERARRGQAGRRLVDSRFTWSQVAHQLTGFYEQLLSDSNEARSERNAQN